LEGKRKNSIFTLNQKLDIMKKMIAIVAIAMFAVACNGSAETPATTTDSTTQVDSTVVAADSTATVDSTSAVK
jgi:hypothetical protein